MIKSEKLVAGVTIAAMATAGVGFAMARRVSEQEAAYKVVHGELVETNLKPGVYLSELLPHVQIEGLSKSLQSVTVLAGEDSGINLRTQERARVYGNYDVMFEIDGSDKNFGDVYTELKADEIEDIMPYVQKFAVPAIIEVYKHVALSPSRVTPAANAESSGEQDSLAASGSPISLDDHLRTGNAIAEELQKILDQQGYTYIKIQRVIASGVELSPEAKAQLELIVAEERKLELSRLEIQVADAAIELSAKQSAANAPVLKGLNDAELGPDPIASAYYRQLERDSIASHGNGIIYLPRELAPGLAPGPIGGQLQWQVDGSTRYSR